MFVHKIMGRQKFEELMSLNIIIKQKQRYIRHYYSSGRHYYRSVTS